MKKLMNALQLQQSSTEINKGTIVVADDDPAILDSLRMILEFHNFTVETIADGIVISKLETLKPQLLLLDISMPGVDGRDICKKLKSVEATKHIPVIMISANMEVQKSVKEAGADDYLAKPFEMQDLIAKVNKHLSN